MDYRILLAKRMLFHRKSSLIGALLAVSIGILVIHVNFVIFQGLYDAIVRDTTDYHFGDVYISHEEGYIERSDKSLITWLERMPSVEAATARLSTTATIDVIVAGKDITEHGVFVIGVNPFNDIKASTIHETVGDGQYVFSKNSIVVGNIVVNNLGGIKVGDNVELLITDRWGQDQNKNFLVSGITNSAGGQGADDSVIVHIDTLRDMMARGSDSQYIMVKLNKPSQAGFVRDSFLSAFSSDYIAETIEESADKTLRGFRFGIAMINVIGYFGMMSSAFAIVTIQMMLVNSKTREVGILRVIGARRKDILIIFIIQGMLIGAIGAGTGTAVGVAYTFFAKETNMKFDNSLELEVSYNIGKIVQTAIMAFFLAIAASLYPAYRATKLQPVEAMRSG
ncbi:MAG: FtsX-like permease family protein [Candidatus Nitrosoabyssus spongiisocia]|nr:MAG: FtsX-like permease family protein [Nitrosopumilaceae archaeon AB1(1)]